MLRIKNVGYRCRIPEIISLYSTVFQTFIFEEILPLSRVCKFFVKIETVVFLITQVKTIIYYLIKKLNVHILDILFFPL